MVKTKKGVKVKVPEPSGNVLGRWAFIIGFVIAIIAGFKEYLPQSNGNVLTFVLIISGIIVGFFNIRDHEAKEYLLAGVSLVLVSWLGSQTVNLIPVYGEILNALQTLFVPATIIVALRSLFVISHK